MPLMKDEIPQCKIVWFDKKLNFLEAQKEARKRASMTRNEYLFAYDADNKDAKVIDRLVEGSEDCVEFMDDLFDKFNGVYHTHIIDKEMDICSFSPPDLVMSIGKDVSLGCVKYKNNDYYEHKRVDLRFRNRNIDKARVFLDAVFADRLTTYVEASIRQIDMLENMTKKARESKGADPRMMLLLDSLVFLMKQGLMPKVEVLKQKVFEFAKKFQMRDVYE